MKSIRIFSIFVLLFSTIVSYAQIPQGFSYQAVIRDSNGDIVANQLISLQFTLFSAPLGGEPLTTQYVEAHDALTNEFGLVSVQVGSGQISVGNFNNLGWNEDEYHLQTEVDLGNGWVNTGMQQLMSVPFALRAQHAETAANAWSLSGNAGTNAGTHFIGTTDNVPFEIRVNNQEAALISPEGDTFFGYEAGKLNTDNSCTGVGYRALASFIGSTENSGNTAFGYLAMESMDNGVFNTAVGNEALRYNAAIYNTAVGSSALSENIDGWANTAIGQNCMANNMDGTFNTAIGNRSLVFNNTGSSNVAIGTDAMWWSHAGSNGTAIGTSAMAHMNSSEVPFTNGNVAVGYQSIRGSFFESETNTGNNNTAIGYQSLLETSTGSGNTGCGFQVLQENMTGNSNTALGNIALKNNVSGGYNTASGHEALSENISGSFNTANGMSSLATNSTGSYNTANGSYALWSSTGNSNAAVGYDAGGNQTTGGNCTFLGYSAEGSVGTYSNATAVGYASTVGGSNEVRIGNTSVTEIGGFEPWTNLSDGRYKKNITENVEGLDFIMKLRPVTYNLEVNKLATLLKEDEHLDSLGNKIFVSPDAFTQESRDQKEQILYTGFIAQEVEVAASSIGYDFSGVSRPDNDEDLYGLRYSEFVVPLVKGMQEQQSLIEAQQRQLDELKKVNALLLSRLEALESGR
jgi:hypothetical protein